MLTAVHIYKPELGQIGDHLELPFDASSGYVVKEIEGLGPVKADIITTEYASMDGGAYQTARGNMRNIVLQLGFDPSYESDDPFGELRRGLYPYLTPKMHVELRFLSSNFETVKILGYVESFEPSIFSAEPEVQISILCPDPYFSSIAPVTVFPNIGESFNIENPIGAVATGFTLTVDEFETHISNPILVKVTKFHMPEGTTSMSLVGHVAGVPGLVVLKIVTIKGSKSAIWWDYEDYDPIDPVNGTNVLGYLDNWLDISPGDNSIKVDLWAMNPLDANVTFSFIPKYAGL